MPVTTVRNYQLHLRSRIKEGSYLFDIILSVYSNVSVPTEQVTLGTIVTKTNEFGQVKFRHNVSDMLCHHYGFDTKNIINQCCFSAEEETLYLNKFFETDF